MRKDQFLRKRHAMIAKAQGAENFAIVISTKPGQKRLDIALKLKALLKKKKKNAILILADELAPSDFDYADIDVIVSTACPRIALDDAESYMKPIITPAELEIALKVKKWKDYSPDMIMG
jgi:2-(3-amino-3-carboxypropyl)histidine synthase